MNTNILRLIDASANRAHEGLRVVEDFVRFTLDDALATEELKRFRHYFTQLMGAIPLEQRLQARETRQDVGTGIMLDSERRRDNVESVLAANFTRIQESLRSLEEYSKVVCPAISAGLEQLRYDSYTIQKIVQTLVGNKNQFPSRVRAIVLNANESVDVHRIENADFVCLSNNSLSGNTVTDKQFVESGRQWKLIVKEQEKHLFIVNRCDIAILVGADGVVLKSDSVSVKQARELLPTTATIGVEIQTDSELRQAFLDGSDWILVESEYPNSSMVQAINQQPSFD